MSGNVTFDGAPPPGTINLGVGQPSADLLPVDLVGAASAAFHSNAHPFELNYGVLQGDERFLASLAGFLADQYGAAIDPDSLFVSGGNSQALDLVSLTFAEQGDTVFVEEPSYYLAFQIFRDHGLKVVGIPMDDEGIEVAALEQALRQHRPALLYTIPSFQNPGGQSLPLARRRKLLELAQEHGFLIVADEAYQLLHFNDKAPPSFGTMSDSGVVVCLGSFSKILAPAMRLGWIQTSPALRKRLLENGFVVSGGSINHISSHIVRHAIELGLLGDHLAHLRRVYRRRSEAMHQALGKDFASLATWTRPRGGYFYWLEFSEGTNTTLLREQAATLQAGFQAGASFSSCGGLSNFLRLSFAHYDEEGIAEGIRRLRQLFD